VVGQWSFYFFPDIDKLRDTIAEKEVAVKSVTELCTYLLVCLRVCLSFRLAVVHRILYCYF
jgi:hypothetical protein